MDILIIVGAVLANIIVLAVEGFPVIRMLITILITSALFLELFLLLLAGMKQSFFIEKECLIKNYIFLLLF